METQLELQEALLKTKNAKSFDHGEILKKTRHTAELGKSEKGNEAMSSKLRVMRAKLNAKEVDEERMQAAHKQMDMDKTGLWQISLDVWGRFDNILQQRDAWNTLHGKVAANASFAISNTGTYGASVGQHSSGRRGACAVRVWTAAMKTSVTSASTTVESAQWLLRSSRRLIFWVAHNRCWGRPGGGSVPHCGCPHHFAE